MVSLVGLLFALPFILFSMTGGFLADRFSKRGVTIATKYFEIAVMILALAALAAHSLIFSLAAIFLACTQGALFGPSKYGLLPELLPNSRLSWGNGILELGTFLAIIAGTVAGSHMAESFRARPLIPGILLLAFTVVGLLTSLGIVRVPAAAPDKKFRIDAFRDLWEQYKLLRADRVLWLAVSGNTYFWFLGALLQAAVIVYGQDVLHVDPTRISFFQASLAVGIGLGSAAAGYLSGGKIEYGLIPLGSIGMTGLGMLLALHGLSFYGVLYLLAGLGFAGGFFVVPVNALIQHRPASGQRGGVIAAANLLSFIGIAAASGAYFLLARVLRVGPAAIFFWASVATLAATAYICYLLPDSLLRLLLWFATHSLYRLDVKGRENVPARGGALLVPNHASMVDAVLLYACIDRPVRFLMFKDLYEHWFIKPFARILEVIPVSSQQRPRELIHSLRAATEALRNGQLVGIFPEGQMTRIGQLLPFRRGMERIMKGADAPIIPVHIDGI
ncbi:MAG TPA: MFS transporter, partial [Methylomirabilota bacterium]|nr:MFS transporter [Methylomirabilota bacterium]